MCAGCRAAAGASSSLVTCSAAIGNDDRYTIKTYDNGDCSGASITTGSGTDPVHCLQLAPDVYVKAFCPRPAVGSDTVSVRTMANCDSGASVLSDQHGVQQGVCTARQCNQRSSGSSWAVPAAWVLTWLCLCLLSDCARAGQWARRGSISQRCAPRLRRASSPILVAPPSSRTVRAAQRWRNGTCSRAAGRAGSAPALDLPTPPTAGSRCIAARLLRSSVAPAC